MPIFKTKNEDFFKKWSPEMAYVLGFFTADGSMIRNKRGAHFIEFEITDKNLLFAIRDLLRSNHKITTRDRNKSLSYRLQIGSKTMFNDLLCIGLTPNKSKAVKLPFVPDEYFSHFVRGYFDGDGHVKICTYKRADRNNKIYSAFQSGFTCGSKKFLSELLKKLRLMTSMEGGSMGYWSNAYRLYFSKNDSLKFYNFIYEDTKNRLFLGRKKIIFERYFKIA